MEINGMETVVSKTLYVRQLDVSYAYGMETLHSEVRKSAPEGAVLPKEFDYFIDVAQKHGAFGVFDRETGSLVAMNVCKLMKEGDEFYNDFVDTSSFDINNLCTLESMITHPNYRKAKLIERGDYDSSNPVFRGLTLAEILTQFVLGYAAQQGREVILADVEAFNFPSAHVLTNAGFGVTCAFWPPEDVRLITLANDLRRETHLLSKNFSDYEGYQTLEFEGEAAYKKLQTALQSGMQASALLRDPADGKAKYILEKSKIGVTSVHHAKEAVA